MSYYLITSDLKGLFIAIALALLLPVTLNGCAQWFPASAQELSPGVYRVQAIGNSFATLSDLNAKIADKAAELCGAESFSYQSLLDLKVKTSTTYLADQTEYGDNAGTQKVEGNYTEVSRTVACTNSQNNAES